MDKMDLAECSEGEDCNRLVFEAVNELSVSKFKLVKRAYNQIQVLTSLVQCNEKGETPLVIAMKGENDSLIDELVVFMQACDCEDFTKFYVMSDALDKLFYQKIPIIELIFHLTKFLPYLNILVDTDGLWWTKWMDILARVVFNSTSLSRPDKIIALELIGASLHNYFAVHRLLLTVMFRFWREAMTLRYFPADGEPLLPKIPYVGVTSVASAIVFGPAVEVMTMEELDQLEEHFERNVVDRDMQVQLMELMRRQSLLVIRRISSQANHGLSNLLYLQSLHRFGILRGGLTTWCFFVDKDNRMAHNTSLLILEEMTDGFDPKHLLRKSFDVFINALCSVSDHLAFMARKPPGSPGKEELSYANLLTLTKFIGRIAKCFPNPAMMLFSSIKRSYNWSHNCSYNGFAEIICDLVFVLVSMSPHLNNQDKQKMEEYLSNYTRNYFLERTTTVLHAGVFTLDGKFPMFENIKLMIKLGADPNAIDKNGNTPLHILAARKNVYSDENLSIFQALVDAGAHLDMAADNGNTVLDILKANLEIHEDKDVATDTYLYFSSVISTSILPLSFFCARVIRRHGIPFDRLPLQLQEYVSRPSAIGRSRSQFFNLQQPSQQRRYNCNIL